MQQPNPTFDCSLRDFINAFLGDRDYAELPVELNHLLDIIKYKSKNTYICYVREADEFDPFIRRPIIYRYAKWRESVELWERQKAVSEKSRQERFIFEYNCRSIAKMLARVAELMEPWSSGCAFSIMKCGRTMKKLNMLDPTFKLIERFEDLP